MTAIAPILITNPWAHGTTAPEDVVIPIDTSSNTIANQVNGFPPYQEEDPLIGGEYVKRAEMNGVFKLYSLLLNFINQGGQFTFNPAVATSGGYDAGVILYCAPDNTFQRSLINGNTANFILTPSFRNDGINWTSEINCGNLQALTVSSTDIIATKNGWNIKIPKDENTPFFARSEGNKVSLGLIKNDNEYGLLIQDDINTNTTKIIASPGFRPEVLCSVEQEISSGIVLQKDVDPFVLQDWICFYNGALGSPVLPKLVTMIHIFELANNTSSILSIPLSLLNQGEACYGSVSANCQGGGNISSFVTASNQIQVIITNGGSALTKIVEMVIIGVVQ